MGVIVTPVRSLSRLPAVGRGRGRGRRGVPLSRTPSLPCAGIILEGHANSKPWGRGSPKVGVERKYNESRQTGKSRTKTKQKKTKKYMRKVQEEEERVNGEEAMPMEKERNETKRGEERETENRKM